MVDFANLKASENPSLKAAKVILICMECWFSGRKMLKLIIQIMIKTRRNKKASSTIRRNHLS